tara:strand:- start:1570 stop:2682 length:1113 start_codon:yes stop_codon:yes gene_type:complete
MKKIILSNFLVLFSLLTLIIIIFSIINFLISGQPRYWEVVHNKKYKNVIKNKEKIIQIKRNPSKKVNFLNVNSEEYKKLGYSSKIKNGNCGSIENGYHELFYQTDKFGFRENKDKRYIFSDYVMLGDSFAQSICENKPNDLKSNLIKKTRYSFLNLGMHGTDYAEQALNLIKYTGQTNFKGLVWVFYEGNDYETKSYEVPNSKIYKLIDSDIINYDLSVNHEITLFFKFKVWLAEFIRGPSVLLKFFKKYDKLLDNKDYEKVLKNVSEFLDNKNIEERYIIYVPSWQKISLHKLKNLKLYKNHPQIKQLNTLKNNVEKISKKNGFIFIDGDSYFLNLSNPLEVFHYNLNSHFNKFGYEILAELISENLVN